MKDCIFCKIRDKKIPAEFIYEDENIMVFPDIRPIKPIHLLIVPKKHIEDLLMINDKGLMMKLIKTTQIMVRRFKLENKGYRVGINGGGAQLINHLHVHLIGPMEKASAM